MCSVLVGRPLNETGPGPPRLSQALSNRFSSVVAPRADMAVERNRLEVEFRGEFRNQGVAALHGGLLEAGIRLLTLVAEQRVLAVARNSPHLSAQAVTAVAVPQTALDATQETVCGGGRVRVSIQGAPS